MATAPGAVSQPTENQVGASPFDAPEFVENIKITKVTRVKLQPTDSTTLQIRDPRNYTFDYDTVTNRWAMKGVTEWILPVISGGPGVGHQAAPVTVYWRASRTYRYRVDEQEVSASGIQ